MTLLRLVFLFVFACTFTARADVSEWQHHESGDVRLIAATNASSDQTLMAGLHIKLNPGWHAYWRSPGDAGLPPTPDWKESVNLEKAELQFPWPRRYALQGLESYAYEGEVVFPVKIAKKDPNAALDLKTKLNMLVCSEICVPADFNLSLSLPTGYQTKDGDEATGLLKTFLARVPKKDDGQGLSLLSANLSEEAGTRIVTIKYMPPSSSTDLELIGEIGDGSTLPYGNSKHDVRAGTLAVELTKDAPKELAGKELTFTLIDHTKNEAVEKKLTIAGLASAPATPIVNTQPSTTATPSMPNIWQMVLFALLGGLILNLMPCVLPVLALKSISFIKHGGGTPSGVRLSFIATSAGILFSFVVMAAAIVGLKHIGMSVGWGIQFQNPIFLIFLIAILALFALNLLGLFEIPLPRFLADNLSWTQGHGSLTKDFFSGAFATLLATPCTAPFLGTAVGFALAAGPFEIFVIFIALGLGLAAPFILIAAFPKTATLLPKPGAWMEMVRKILGILLLLTAFWLGSVLFHQLTASPEKDAADTWQAFDEKKIAELVAQDKIVYVDVTADWCLTCQVNKKLVLDAPEIQAALSGERIVKMKADWTKRDEVIGAYLKSFMRYGIPFNVVYSQKLPQGLPLPELLTKESVKEALAKAGL